MTACIRIVLICLLLSGCSQPLFLIRTYSELRADIYEVSTGRIVWRGQRRDSIDAADAPRISLAELFVQLELADAKVATEAQG